MGWLTLPYLTAEVVSKGNTRRGCTTKTSCASELEGWGRRRLGWEPDPPRIEGKGVCQMSVVDSGWSEHWFFFLFIFREGDMIKKPRNFIILHLIIFLLFEIFIISHFIIFPKISKSISYLVNLLRYKFQYIF